MEQTGREATLLQAFIPIVFLITFLVFNVIYFGDGTLDGSNQVVLILASAIAGIIAIRLGRSWEFILDKIVVS